MGKNEKELYKNGPIENMDTENREFLSENSPNPICNFLDQTFKQSAYDEKSYFNPFNPDDLYQKKGDYSIFDDMINDDQVNICLQLKKDLVLGKGFKITCKNQDYEEIEHFLKKELIDDCDFDLQERLEEILTAYEYGFSVTEKIFKKNQDGYITLRDLRTRYPNTWLIPQDSKGNIMWFEQQGVERVVKLGKKDAIHYVINQKFQNPYGVSDLRACYAAWFIKKQIIRYYAIFLEKNASPVPIARYKQGIPSAVINEIYNAIKSFQQKSCLVAPEEFNLDFLETNSKGEAYTKGINLFNMFIGRSLFCPDLLGFQGDETSGGSYSLGQTQMEIFFNHIKRRRSKLEQIVNREIIKPMVLCNFGFLEGEMPRFELNEIEEADIMSFADKFLAYAALPWYKPSLKEINHFKNLINFPTTEEDEFETINPPSEDPFEKNAGGNPGIEKDMEKIGQKIEDIGHGMMDNQKKKSEFSKTKLPNQIFSDLSDGYDRVVNYAKINDQFEENGKEVEKEARPIIDSIFEDLYDQMRKKKIIDNQRIDRIDSIKLKKLKDLKQLLNKNMRNIWKEGKLEGTEESKKIKKDAPDKKENALADEQFLRILDEENFNFVGDWEYNVTKQARIEMIAAVKDGRPISSVIDILDEKGKKDAMISVERYARTKTTEVFNKGRLATFEQSGIVQGYQYSAILDDQTSDICRGLHGKKFKAGQQPIPPMHFNCRSVLVPISNFEDAVKFDKTVTVTDKNGKQKEESINKFIDENKGKGFSKQ